MDDSTGPARLAADELERGRKVIDRKTDWLAKQDALEKATAKLQITEEVLPLTVPGHTIGEAVGVSKNSQNHLFVFTRSGNVGPAKGATASQLFEFDQPLKFVKQWGRTTTPRHSPTRSAWTSTTTSG